MWDQIRRAGAVAWALVGLTLLLVIVGMLAWWLRVIWPPLIFAGAIVFILNPVVTWISEHARVRRSIATALTYLAMTALVVGIGFALSPVIGEQASELSEEWPEIQAEVEKQIDELAERSVRDDWFLKVPTVQEIEDEINGGGDANLGETLTTIRQVGAKVFHVGLIFVLAPIIAFYLLVDLPNVRRSTEALIPANARAEVMLIGHRLSGAIGGFFRGQLMVAMIVGVLVSIPLGIIGLPFWVIVGMIAGVANMVPLIGPWVGGVPGVLIALTAGEGVGQAVLVVLIMAGVQQVDNHFITPVVMRRAVHLHPAVVMLALLAGGTIGGFFGLLLAVPVTAVLKILCGHLWRTWVLGEPLDEIARKWEIEDSEPAVGFVERLGGDSKLEPDDGDVEGTEAADASAATGTSGEQAERPAESAVATAVRDEDD